MIVGFIGDIGGGKTASLVKEVYIKYLSGRKIFSNIKLNFPYTHVSQEDLLEMASGGFNLQDGVLVLDEIHIYLDSRTSMSKENRVITYFALQTRKVGVDLYYTTQYINQVDLRLRNLTNALIECYTQENSETKEKYTLNVIRMRKINKVITKKIIFQTSKVYNLYNTYEVVSV